MKIPKKIENIQPSMTVPLNITGEMSFLELLYHIGATVNACIDKVTEIAELTGTTEGFLPLTGGEVSGLTQFDSGIKIGTGTYAFTLGLSGNKAVLNVKPIRLGQVADPTETNDAANKKYVDSSLEHVFDNAPFLPLSGGIIDGEIQIVDHALILSANGTTVRFENRNGTVYVENAAGNNVRLVGLASPQVQTGAANKEYVDAQIATRLSKDGGGIGGDLNIHGDVQCVTAEASDGIISPIFTVYRQGAPVDITADANGIKIAKSMGGGKPRIGGVANPVNGDDVATRAYVQDSISRVAGGVPQIFQEDGGKSLIATGNGAEWGHDQELSDKIDTLNNWQEYANIHLVPAGSEYYEGYFLACDDNGDAFWAKIGENDVDLTNIKSDIQTLQENSLPDAAGNNGKTLKVINNRAAWIQETPINPVEDLTENVGSPLICQYNAELGYYFDVAGLPAVLFGSDPGSMETDVEYTVKLKKNAAGQIVAVLA